ncbi:flavodoxin family protein [Actinokineospora soli]|uniref:Flavodoxin family protein n=1 Tax=Actinokineospora soli TaxID=1048753 RepID=A0ABW2TUX5_9PSEU
MPTLLIVHHTPSPTMQALFEAVLAGARDPELEGVDVVRRAALSATAKDLLDADGVVLGTPANIGYMSGALKHFFDTVYYPSLDSGRGTPFGFYVHGNEGVEGAVSSIVKVAKALSWKQVAEAVTVLGAPGKADLERCRELGGTVAASLL